MPKVLKSFEKPFVVAILATAVSCSSGGGVEGEYYDLPNGVFAATAGTPFSEDPITQSALQPGGNAEILFMMDSSTSLDNERAALAAALPELTNELTEVGELTAAFSLSWISQPGTGPFEGSGHLYRVGSNPYVLDRTALTLSGFQEDIRETLTTPAPEDNSADGGEAGLYSLHNLLTTYRGKAESQGFLKAGSALFVIFIADENDLCAIYPEGVTPVADPGGEEAVARDRYCSGITPESVVAAARAVKGSDALALSGVVYTTPVFPQGDEHEMGYGYLEAIQASGGVAVNLASTDLTGGLRNLGNTINALASKIQRRFVLSQSNVNPFSIQVRVDGQPVTFRYTREDNSVLLDYAGHPGSVVQISYRVIER